MKLEIERDALLAALRQVVDVVQSRNTIPVLGNLLLVAEGGELRITGTDLDLQATARVIAAGELRTTVDKDKLLAAVTSLKPGLLTFDKTGNDPLVIKQGRGQRKLTTLPAEDFPCRAQPENPAIFKLPAASLSRLFEATFCAMSKEEVRYYLGGVFLHIVDGKLRAAATDGHRMIRAEMAAPEGTEALRDTIVPDKTVNHMRRILAKADGEVTVRVSDRAIQFEVGGAEIASKVIDGTFPDYERVVPGEQGNKLELARDALLDPVQAVAAVLSAEGDKIKVRSVAFNLKEGDDGCEVTGQDSGGTFAQEPLDVTYSGEPIRFGLNHGYAVSVGNIFSESAMLRLWIADPKAPIRVTSDKDPDLLAVIMPMRA